MILPRPNVSFFLALASLFPLSLSGAANERFEAVLEPESAVSLALDVAGIVETVEVREGETVAAGGNLLRLRSRFEELKLREAEARLDRARERLAELERREARYAGLRERNLVSEDQWSELSLRIIDARGTVAMAGSEVDLAREELERRVLRAPARGVVFRVSRRPGEGVRPQDVLVELMSADRLRANFFLPARFVGRFRPGETVEVGVPGPDGESRRAEATVDRVDPFVDPATGVMRLSVLLPGGEKDLAPGDEVEIFIASPGAGEDR